MATPWSTICDALTLTTVNGPAKPDTQTCCPAWKFDPPEPETAKQPAQLSVLVGRPAVACTVMFMSAVVSTRSGTATWTASSTSSTTAIGAPLSCIVLSRPQLGNGVAYGQPELTKPVTVRVAEPWPPIATRSPIAKPASIHERPSSRVSEPVVEFIANSISSALLDDLATVWERVEGGGEVRALVIASANPQLFCAGADIKGFTAQMANGDGGRIAERTHALLRAFERSGVVTVAAVNGFALGGGCELAMACDIRIAAQSARFGQPEIGLGIMPGFGGTQRLPRLVGTNKALEMNLTGESIGADEAYEFGLVNRVVPDHELLDAALAWARKLAGQPPLAVRHIKQASADPALDAALEAEQRAFAEVFTTDDAREGVAAFVEKRQARWRGT